MDTNSQITPEDMYDDWYLKALRDNDALLSPYRRPLLYYETPWNESYKNGITPLPGRSNGGLQ